MAFAPFNAVLTINNTKTSLHSVFLRRGTLNVTDSSVQVTKLSIHTIYSTGIEQDCITLKGKTNWITQFSVFEAIGPLAGTLRLAQVQHTTGGSPRTGIIIPTTQVLGDHHKVALTLMNTEFDNCGWGIRLSSGTHFHLLSHNAYDTPLRGTITSGLALLSEVSTAQDIRGFIQGTSPSIGQIHIPSDWVKRTFTELKIEPIYDAERNIYIENEDSTFNASPQPSRTKVRVVSFNAEAINLVRGDIVRSTSSGGVVRSQGDVVANFRGLLGVCLTGILPTEAYSQFITEGPARIRMVGGLILSVGDTLYLSYTVPGLATNIASIVPGEYNIPIGYIMSPGSYSGVSGEEILGYVRIDTGVSNPRYLTLG
jgi:hypothetical protein